MKKNHPTPNQNINIKFTEDSKSSDNVINYLCFILDKNDYLKKARELLKKDGLTS